MGDRCERSEPLSAVSVTYFCSASRITSETVSPRSATIAFACLLRSSGRLIVSFATVMIGSSLSVNACNCIAVLCYWLGWVSRWIEAIGQTDLPGPHGRPRRSGQWWLEGLVGRNSLTAGRIWVFWWRGAVRVGSARLGGDGWRLAAVGHQGEIIPGSLAGIGH